MYPPPLACIMSTICAGAMNAPSCSAASISLAVLTRQRLGYLAL